jgi:hypothetical protein
MKEPTMTILQKSLGIGIPPALIGVVLGLAGLTVV